MPQMLSSPVGLPRCRFETPAWTTLPPWTSCSRRIPRPPASAGAATGPPAAARRRSTDTFRSPTSTDPPTPLFYRKAAQMIIKKMIKGVSGVGIITLNFESWYLEQDQC